jgi:hypothetical protein
VLDSKFGVLEVDLVPDTAAVDHLLVQPEHMHQLSSPLVLDGLIPYVLVVHLLVIQIEET